MTFPKSLFRDTDVNTLNPKKHARGIISRVFMRGDVDTMKQVLKYYGKQRVQKVLQEIKYLDNITLSFVSNLFDCDKSSFACSKNKPSIQIPGDF